MKLIDKVKINEKYVIPITSRLRVGLNAKKGDFLAFYLKEPDFIIKVEKMPVGGDDL